MDKLVLANELNGVKVKKITALLTENKNNRTADIYSDRCVQLNNQSKRIEKILKTNNFFQLTKRFII